MMTVTLPYPPSSLSPNARGHWSIKAKAAAKARRDASIICQASGIRALGWPAMHVSIEFRAPDRRRRDADNMLSSCKSLLDGLADASGVDDSRWSITITRGAPVKGGAVIITVEAVQANTKDNARQRANAPGMTANNGETGDARR